MKKPPLNLLAVFLVVVLVSVPFWSQIQQLSESSFIVVNAIVMAVLIWVLYLVFRGS